DAYRQNLGLLPHDRSWIAQVESRSYRDRILGDEKLVPIVQGRHGNRAQRPIGNEHERVDPRLRQIRFDRADKPAVELAGVRQVLPCCPLLQLAPELPYLFRERVEANWDDNALEAGRKAEQQLGAVWQENRVDDDSGPGHDVELGDLRQRRV